MDSIAVTRPHMAVLSQGKLPLTPFGALAQAFAEEVLARAELEEGRYPYVPLELLEEGEEAPPVQTPAPVLQVDLHLILEALRKEQGRTEQVRTTERIVERILRLQKERETRTVERTGRPDREPVKGPGTIHQEFVQVLNQDIRLFSVQGAQLGEKGGAQSRYAAAPGQLGQRSAAFFRELQTLHQEGKPLSAPAWAGSGPTAGPASAEAAVRPQSQARRTVRQETRPLSPEDLSYLEAGEGTPETPETASPARLAAELTRAAERAADRVLRRSREGREASPRRVEPATGSSRGAAAPGGADTRQENNSSAFKPTRGEGPEEFDRTSGGGDRQAASQHRRDGGRSAPAEPAERRPAGPDLREESTGPEGQARTAPGAAGPKAPNREGGLPVSAREIGRLAAQPLAPAVLPPEALEGEPGPLAVPPIPAEIVYRTDGAEEGHAGSASDRRPSERERDSDRSREKTRPTHAPDAPLEGQREPGEQRTSGTARGSASAPRPQGPGGTGEAVLGSAEAARRESGTSDGSPSRPEPGSGGLSSTARDVRIGRHEGVAPEGTAPQAEVQPGGAFGQSPSAELVHRTAPEGEPAPTDGAGRSAYRQDAPAQAGPAHGAEAGPGSAVEAPAEERSRLSTARDVRIGRHEGAAPEGTAPQAEVQPGGAFGQSPSAELVHRTAPEGEPALSDGAGRSAYRQDTPAQAGPAHGTEVGPGPAVGAPAEERSRLSTARDVRIGQHEGAALEGTVPQMEVQPGGVLGRPSPAELIYRRAAEDSASTAQAGTVVPPPSRALVHPAASGEEVPRAETTARKGPRQTSPAAQVEGQPLPLTVRDVRMGHGQGESPMPGPAAWRAEPEANLPHQPSELVYRVGPEEEGPSRGEGVASAPVNAPMQKRGYGPLTEGQALPLAAREIRAGHTQAPAGKADPAASGARPSPGGQLSHPMGGALPPLQLARPEGEMPAQSGAVSSARPERSGQGAGRGGAAPWGKSPFQTGGGAEAGTEAPAGFFQGEGTQALPAELVYRMEGEARDSALPDARQGTAPQAGAERPLPRAARPVRNGRPHSAARDIRVGSGRAWTGTAAPAEEPHGAAPAGWEAERGRTPAAPGTPASGPAPVELTYSQSQPRVEPPQVQGAPGQAQAPVESDYVRSLPDWARRFLRESGGQGPAEREMGVARSIASLPEQEETVQWTAPNYRPPAAPLAYREKKEDGRPKGEPEPHISDAELQRTADRVYRMIEDRIRRERRRLGF